MASGIEAKVCADIEARQMLGINKYGTTVAENPLSLRQWLEHAYQEALDQAIYLRRAMAEIDKQQDKPAAWMSEENDCLFFDKDKPNPMNYDFWTPLYTRQQPRKPLTDEQIMNALKLKSCDGYREIVRAIEAAHGIKE